MPRKKSEKTVEEQEEFEVDEPSEVEELENNATDDDWTPADEEVSLYCHIMRFYRLEQQMLYFIRICSYNYFLAKFYGLF